MSGTGDRQKFGNTFDDAEQDHIDEVVHAEDSRRDARRRNGTAPNGIA
jgi:hypothetical protein